MRRIVLYHNPRCSKSRRALELLREGGYDIQVREYLKEPLSSGELEILIRKIGILPNQLIRTTEMIFKKLEIGNVQDLSKERCVELLVEHPELLERPILETEEKACVGRPPELILDILG